MIQASKNPFIYLLSKLLVLKINFRTIFLFTIINFIYTQGLTTDISSSQLIEFELKAIQNSQIDENLFIQPVRQKVKTLAHLNLFSKLSRKIKLEPVFGLRWSSSGFEFDPQHTPGSVLWLTPGIKISSVIPVAGPFSNIWIYAWGRFNKHSAYGFNGGTPTDSTILGYYNPKFAFAYFDQTQKPENGIDFDEGEGGISIITPSFDLTLGTFRTNFGPFFRSNLSLSKNCPAFPQIRLHWNFADKIHFSYIMGSLQSGILDTNATEIVFTADDGFQREKMYSRYVVNHRLDFIPVKQFRFGLYEQVIFGGRDVPLEYMNPLMPYWSAQHALGDLDNVQMGFDWEWIIKTNRVYGAFFMDEWAPFDTFDAKENHNWFGCQLGFSHLFILEENPLLFKLEYTWLDPRIYVHRFPVNYPQHNDYNLGFWSGGNSDDIIALLYYRFGKITNLQFSYQKTRIGIQEPNEIYQGNIPEFLNGFIRLREITGLKYEKTLNYSFILEINVKYFNTKNLYNDDHFFDFTTAIRYNIPY